MKDKEEQSLRQAGIDAVFKLTKAPVTPWTTALANHCALVMRAMLSEATNSDFISSMIQALPHFRTIVEKAHQDVVGLRMAAMRESWEKIGEEWERMQEEWRQKES